MCTKELESVPHVLAGCSALAQTKYMSRHNSAPKILFFEILRERGLIDKIPPWYSQVDPKPLYENEKHKAFWDVPSTRKTQKYVQIGSTLELSTVRRRRSSF